MNYRHTAILLAGILTSVRVFDPTLLENSTDFAFHAAQVFDISFFDVRSPVQTMIVFYAIVMAELLCALYLLYLMEGESNITSRRLAFTVW